jgi:hypothetical protein
MENRTITDLGFSSHKTVGADLDIDTYLGRGVNARGLMYFRQAPPNALLGASYSVELYPLGQISPSASARSRSDTLVGQSCAIRGCEKKEKLMAKTIATRKRIVRRDWTRADVKELRKHSRDKTPVKTISRALKRTPGALRQKARALGIPLGHHHPKRRRA